MKDSTIRELRGVLIRKLFEYEGKPVKLDIPSDILEKILFEYRSHWDEKYKVFARDLIDYEVLPSDILHKIDFTGVSFKDFECCNLTKRYVGITLNPQEIYEKNLFGVNLDGITLELDERGFKGVKVNKTRFKGAKVKGGGPIIINPQDLYKKDLSYANLDGVTIDLDERGFKEVRICCTNFKGAKAKNGGRILINPQVVWDKELDASIFDGVEFTGSFDGASICSSNFAGSIGAVINPQKLSYRFLVNTVLKDAYIIGENMEGVNIENTDFRGHKGKVIINPQLLAKKSLKGCKLQGVIINGPLDSCILLDTDFTGSIGGYYEGDNYGQINSETNLTDVDVSRIEQEKRNKERVKKLIFDSFNQHI